MKTNHTLTNKPDPKTTQSIRNPVVYYESIKRELKIICMYECMYEIETRLIDEKFANAMGEYVT